MSRETDFSLVDDSKGEHYRRKMRAVRCVNFVIIGFNIFKFWQYIY